MINPGGLVAALVAIVVGGSGTIADGNGSPDDFRISLGTGRANLASGGVFSREFFGMLAVDEGGLFIAKPNVSAETWGIVAPRGITAQAACIQIHAAIQFDQDVFGGTIRPCNYSEWLAGFHHGDGGLVGVRDRSSVGRIAAVAQSRRIEGCIAIASVFAGNGDPRNFRSILVKRDGCVGP